MAIIKKIISVILRVGISLALLIFLFRQVDTASLLETLRNSDKPKLVIAFLAFSLVYILCFVRWEMLLKAAQINIPFRRVLISACGGIFFNLFLPSTIGGDLVRTIDLAMHTKRPREVVATVLLDRLSGYVGLVILAVIAVIIGHRYIRDASVLFMVAVITAILIVILLVLFNSRIYSKVNNILRPRGKREAHGVVSVLSRLRGSLKNLHSEMHIFRNYKKVIVYNLILSFAVQLVFPLIFYLIALSLGVRLNIIYFLVFLPIIGAITLIPISIGGLGLRDATTIYFFAKVGLSKDLSFAMSLLSFSFILIYGVIGGLIYVSTLHHRRVQYNQTPPVCPSPE
jgi:uncharacterized protein (TIRG00374 family)